MIYECKHCGYTTNRQLNLIRHENRKNPCRKTTNGRGVGGDRVGNNVIPSTEFVTHNTEFVIPNPQNVITNSDTSKITCNKCNKDFKSKNGYRKHLLKCNGVDRLTCPICFEVFKTRDQKYRHKKNVICRPPQIPLSQLVNQHPFDTDTTEYIYLLQTRESLRNKETIYKVGRTCKEGLQRFKFYPKGSKLLLHIFCFDSVTVEKNILSQFNDKFKNASTYGKEYFDGELTEMVSIVLKEVSSTFNCCFSMTRI